MQSGLALILVRASSNDSLTLERFRSWMHSGNFILMLEWRIFTFPFPLSSSKNVASGLHTSALGNCLPPPVEVIAYLLLHHARDFLARTQALSPHLLPGFPGDKSATLHWGKPTIHTCTLAIRTSVICPQSFTVL